MKYKPLRACQQSALDSMMPLDWRTFVLAAPTGSGKSWVIAGLAYLNLRWQGRRPACWGDASEVKKVIVATPMQHIESGYVDEACFHYSAEGVRTPLRVKVAEDFWLRVREMKGAAGDNLRKLVSGEKGTGGRAILTSHQLLVSVYKDGGLPADMSDTIIILDEGHHHGESPTAIYRVVQEMRRRGARSVLPTATPLRSDGHALHAVSDGVKWHITTYSSLARRKEAPSKLCLDVATSSAGGRARDYLLGQDLDLIVDKALAYRDESGALRPVHIHLPPSAYKGQAYAVAQLVIERLVARGVPRSVILDTTSTEDTSEEVSKKTQRVLKAENARIKEGGYEAAAIRVVIDCKRFGEGANLPTLSHVILVGVTQSLAHLIQIIGRSTRCKLPPALAGYPEQWQDEVRVTALVPHLDSPTAIEDHAARIVMLSCLLECSTAAYDIECFWAPYAPGMRLPPRTPITKGDVSQLAPLSPEERVEGAMVGTKAAARLWKLYGRMPTIEELLREVGIILGGEDRTVLETILSQAAEADPAVAASLEEAAADVCDRLQEAFDQEDIKDRSELTAWYEEHMHDALKQVAKNHADLTYPHHVGDRLVGLSSVLSADRMAKIVAEMETGRDAAFNTMSLPEIIENTINPFIAKHKKLPQLDDPMWLDSAYQHDYQIMRAVDRHLRRKGISLSHANALRQYLHQGPVDKATMSLVRQVFAGRRLPMFTVEDWKKPSQLAAAMQTPRLNLQRYGVRGESLLHLTMCARYGWRGFEGGQSLPEALGL